MSTVFGRIMNDRNVQKGHHHGEWTRNDHIQIKEESAHGDPIDRLGQLFQPLTFFDIKIWNWEALTRSSMPASSSVRQINRKAPVRCRSTIECAAY